MLTQYNLYKNFCRITSKGLEVATYAEIRNSLIAKYKQIYGTDIDLNDASADGQWIAEQALIYNNMCQSLKLMYDNLDPNTASGKFLDMICAFSNVYRRPPSYSTTTVRVKASMLSELVPPLDFLDDNGTIWTWRSENGQVMRNNGDYFYMPVTCAEIGPITAPAGSINRTVLAINSISEINQPEDAIPGSYEESDADLRARRNQSLATSATTVREGLTGALLALANVDAVKIYDEGNAVTAADGTSVPSHAVYVIAKVRQTEFIQDSVIGNIIYQMMTPGILTTESDVAASSKSYNYQVTDTISKTVYWKQISGVNAAFSIVLTKKDFWSSSTSVLLANTLIEYLASQPIGHIPSNFEILSKLQSVDPLYRGQATYSITSASITNSADILADNAVKKQIVTAQQLTITPNGDTITITKAA